MNAATEEDTDVGGSNGRMPSRRVLVLNRNWQAVNIIGVRRAFSLLWQDHARVINTFGKDFAPMTTAEWLSYSMNLSTPPPG